MKKAIFLFVLFIFIFSSCVNKTGKNANWDIDEDLETEMCSIYREKLYNHMLITPDLETFIQYYFGDYNGNPVVYMGHTNLIVSMIPTTVEIDGYTFTFPSDRRAMLFKDSVFYSFEEAYELGYLKIDDIKSLGKRIEEDVYYEIDNHISDLGEAQDLFDLVEDIIELMPAECFESDVLGYLDDKRTSLQGSEVDYDDDFYRDFSNATKNDDAKIEEMMTSLRNF